MTTTPPTSSPGRTRIRVDIVPGAGSRVVALAPVLFLLLAYLVATLGALTGRPWVFAVGAVLAVVVEAVLSPATRVAGWALTEVRLGPLARCLVRGVLGVALLARCAPAGGTVTAGVLGWLAVAVLAATAYGLVELITVLRKAPVLCRNVDLARDLAHRDGPDIPPEPSPWRLDVRTPAVLDVPLVAGVVFTAHDGRAGWVWAGAAVSAVLTLASVVALAVDTHRLRRANPRRRVPAAIQRAVAELEPEVVLYHAGEPATAYQVESWLEVMEQLGRTTLVLLRNPRTLAVLAPTTLPVVCIEASTQLVGFDLPSVRAALFVANGAGNVHLLRRTGIGFAFIGHGDSDKASSATPFARVYDEVWVAGPAGRERYVAAGDRLAAGSVVEVGRPQLAALQRDPGPRDSDATRRTVLYAPTWEGWGDDPDHSSLALGGVELVRALLAQPDVRVIYRPHPLTGTRDRATDRAHRAVLAAIRAAGGLELSAPPGPPAGRIGDALTMAQQPAPAGRTEFFGITDGTRDVHLAALGRVPGLLWCFDESDLMIADISAVVTDWLATGRPYAIVNVGRRTAEDLLATAPSTSAGDLIGPDLAGLTELLADLRTGRDPHAVARAQLAADLLGPLGSESLERFRAAVDALGERVRR